MVQDSRTIGAANISDSAVEKILGEVIGRVETIEAIEADGVGSTTLYGAGVPEDYVTTAVAASAFATLAGNALEGDTVTAGGITITFMDVPTTEDEALSGGADGSEDAATLVTAFQAHSGYAAEDYTVEQNEESIVFTAKVGGADGNAITFYVGNSGASFSDHSQTFTGGVDTSAGVGSDGDYYVDVASGDVYGARADGAWGSPVPQGGARPGTTVTLTDDFHRIFVDADGYYHSDFFMWSDTSTVPGPTHHMFHGDRDGSGVYRLSASNITDVIAFAALNGTINFDNGSSPFPFSLIIRAAGFTPGALGTTWAAVGLAADASPSWDGSAFSGKGMFVLWSNSGGGENVRFVTQADDDNGDSKTYAGSPTLDLGEQQLVKISYVPNVDNTMGVVTYSRSSDFGVSWVVAGTHYVYGASNSFKIVALGANVEDAGTTRIDLDYVSLSIDREILG